MEGGKQRAQGYKNKSPTSSELETEVLLFQIGLLRRLPVATVVLHHRPALVHQLLLTKQIKFSFTAENNVWDCKHAAYITFITKRSVEEMNKSNLRGLGLAQTILLLKDL